MREELKRLGYANLGQPDITEISGHLHERKFVAIRLGQVNLHVEDVAALRDLSRVAGRMADELEAARAAEVSEVERLRRRVAELEAGDQS